MGFRSDINGLRAIAVLGVVLFHFDATLLPGGFAGVDVFFFISGFLMTGIIFSKFSDESLTGIKFSLLSFYKARAFRIVPALSVLCLALLLFGWFFLIPIDYKELGKHAAGSITFISNLIYWQEAGYFDTVSHEKWLLHTWSLSVEWQFYIIYPAILLLLRRFFLINTVKVLVFVGAVLGFALCVFVTYKWADAAYYLLPTRAWQMLIGGVAFLYPLSFVRKFSSSFQWLGLLLIMGCYVFISGDAPWPGYLAMLPVLGAFFVIQAKHDNTFILGNFLTQKIGLWSYSIYLWHWVFVVANIKFELEAELLSYLLVTLIAGAFSYYLFERRSYMYIVFSFSLALSLIVLSTHGVSSRVDPKFSLDKTSFHRSYYGGSDYPSNKFFFLNGSKNEWDYVFIGDSFGLQYAKAIDETGYKVAALFHHGCLIFPNYSRYRNNGEDLSCSVEYDKVNYFLSETRVPVIIANSWDSYVKILVKKGGSKALNLSHSLYYEILQGELDNIVSENGSSRHYFVLGVPQRTKENAFECLARTDLLGYRLTVGCDIKQKRVEYPVNEVLRSWADRNSNTHFINPNDFICNDKYCLTIKDREPIHSDGSHLSVFGAPLVVDGLFPKINFIINK
jgi:peptidoglycan/LPS O-acetylase OafA/YrhL